MLVRIARVKALPPPLEFPTFSIKQHWHERYQQHPAHKWLRSSVADLFLESKRGCSRAAAYRFEAGVSRTPCVTQAAVADRTFPFVSRAVPVIRLRWPAGCSPVARPRVPSVPGEGRRRVGGDDCWLDCRCAALDRHPDDLCQQEHFSRASDCVDRILRGAKAANTPVEQPLRYDFIVNLKTVRAMGLTIPRALRIRADEMIE